MSHATQSYDFTQSGRGATTSWRATSRALLSGERDLHRQRRQYRGTHL